MAAVLPTKGNLILTKRSRALAQTGFALMDRKRNILIREMMALMDNAKQVQDQIDRVFTEAYAALQSANIELGICDQIAQAVGVDESLTLQYRSVMGVELPHIPAVGSVPAPEYGFAYTSGALDECYLKFHRVKECIRQMAEIETSIYRLAQAIKKTQKRANALQNIVIPGFDSTVRLITDALEEKEREEFVRLKVIKAFAAKKQPDTGTE
ncbi:MAG: V-type ATP synthase subunit D [Pseudoflavonifractor sp.]